MSARAGIVVTGTDDTGAPVSLTVNSGADGSWSFPNLRPGSYTVTETTQPAGTSNGITFTVTLPSLVTWTGGLGHGLGQPGGGSLAAHAAHPGCTVLAAGVGHHLFNAQLVQPAHGLAKPLAVQGPGVFLFPFGVGQGLVARLQGLAFGQNLLGQHAGIGLRVAAAIGLPQ